MESAAPTVIDLAALERQLALRAEFHDHPGSYRDGVHDVVAALRQQGVAPPGEDRTATPTSKVG
jgi:hypothetical protein